MSQLSDYTLEEKRAYQREQNRERNRRWRLAHPEKAREKSLRWVQNHPEQFREILHRRYLNDPRKRRANWTVQNAINSGKMVRPTTCSQCGVVGKMDAHHHKGYDREFWLDVVWLCRRCHHAADKWVTEGLTTDPNHISLLD